MGGCNLCRRLRRCRRRGGRIVTVVVLVSGGGLDTAGGGRSLVVEAVRLQMLPEGGGVGVGLVAAPGRTVERLVRCVHMHVFLTIAGVGEATITALDLTLKRLFT